MQVLNTFSYFERQVMKLTLLATIVALTIPAASYAPAYCQMGDMKMPPPPPPSTGPASEVLRSYTTLKPNVIKAAEKMPEAVCRRYRDREPGLGNVLLPTDLPSGCAGRPTSGDGCNNSVDSRIVSDLTMCNESIMPLWTR
jgi:hypothetical protein